MNLIQRLHDRRVRIKSDINLRPYMDWFLDRDLELPINASASAVLESVPSFKSSIINVLIQLKAEVDSVTEDGRVTFREMVGFVVRASKLLYAEAKKYELDSEKTKEAVLYALDEFYTVVISPLDIPFVPSYIENSLVDPALGKWWHDAASGMYDALFLSDPEPVLPVKPAGAAPELGSVASGGMPDDPIPQPYCPPACPTTPPRTC